MELFVSDINLFAHVCSEALREMLEINKAISLRVKYIFHKVSDFSFSNINFILQQVLFKIFVGYITISILVKFTENLIHLVFTIEQFVFDLTHHCAESSSFSFIFRPSEDFRRDFIKALVDESGRRISSGTLTKEPREFFVILKEN